MTYNIDNVTPRPWRVIPARNEGESYREIHTLDAPPQEVGFVHKHDAAHIVHCVNNHARLISALADLIGAAEEAHRWDTEDAWNGYNAAEDEARAALAAAKAEES